MHRGQPRGCGRSGTHVAPWMLKMSPWLEAVTLPDFLSLYSRFTSTCTSMARVNCEPTPGRASAQTNRPELPTALGLGGRCFHSISRMKFSYILSERRKPIGVPVVTISLSLTVKVPGALLTLTQ